MHRYYLTLRPAMPGTVPTKNLSEMNNYDKRQFDENAGRDVWGYVEYTEPLSNKEVWEYELIDGGVTNGK